MATEREQRLPMSQALEAPGQRLPPTSPGAWQGAVKPRLRADHVADLLTLLLILYAVHVLTPVFVAPDFINLELSSELAETSESNFVNQLFWVGATGLGVIAIAPVWRRCLRAMLTSSPCLGALAALSLLSATWAVEPGISLRRAVLQVMVIFCVVAAVGGSRSTRQCLRLLYASMAIAMVVHLSAVALPGTFDWQGDFRGVFDDKNGLGAVAAIAILLGGAIRPDLTTRLQRRLNLVYLGGWLIIVALAHSKTSLGMVVIIPSVVLGLHLVARSTKLGIGIYLTVLPMIIAAALTFVIWGMGIPPMRLLGMISPDATFTGRTDIWMFVLDSLNGHWLLGYGYQSFWNVGPSSPNLKAAQPFIRLLNQAHNGYLDVLLSIGAVGLALVLATIVQGFAAASRVRESDPTVYRTAWVLIIFAMLHNGTETSLVRGYAPTWLFLLFALALAARAADHQRYAAAPG